MRLRPLWSDRTAQAHFDVCVQWQESPHDTDAHYVAKAKQKQRGDSAVRQQRAPCVNRTGLGVNDGEFRLELEAVAELDQAALQHAIEALVNGIHVELFKQPIPFVFRRVRVDGGEVEIAQVRQQDFNWIVGLEADEQLHVEVRILASHLFRPLQHPIDFVQIQVREKWRGYAPNAIGNLQFEVVIRRVPRRRKS